MKIRYLVYCGITAAIASCASIDPATITRDPGVQPYRGSRADLVDAGAKLWKDPAIGNSGLSCQSCHINNAQFKQTFSQPYPHKVAMASNMAKQDAISTEQMVQLCMIVPMKSKPLPWNSKELAALAAYIDDVVQPQYAASKK